MTKQATIKKQVAGAAGSTTRRSFLGNVAKVSAVAAVAVAPVKCAPGPMAPAPAHAAAVSQADTELLALGAQFDAAYAHWDAVNRAYNDAQKAYFAMRPELPKELIDPFGGVIPWSRVGQGVAASCALWTAADLRRSIERWSRPDAVSLKADDLALAGKLLPIAERYEAVDAEADRKSGLSEWLRQDAEAADRVCRLCDRILKMTATTAAGVALQARVFKTWIEPDWWNPEGPETGIVELFVARATDRLMAQALNVG